MGRKIRLLIFLCGSFLLSYQVSFGQQDPQFTQYMFNYMYYNPGYAGMEGLTKLTAVHRSQWLGYRSSFGDGSSPQTQIISLSTPMLNISSGAGVYILNDNLAERNNVEIQAAYSYHLPLGKGKLGLGARAGIYNMTINFQAYRWNNPQDPLNQQERQTQTRPDLALGAFYRAPKWYFGASFNHLTRAEFTFSSDSLRNPLERHTYVTGGYDFSLNQGKLVLTPSAMFKSDLNTYSVDIGVVGVYDEKFWGGATFRQGDALNILFGYSFFKTGAKEGALKVGYSFDYIFFNAEAKSLTSHELLLSYALPIAEGVDRNRKRTPRFPQ